MQFNCGANWMIHFECRKEKHLFSQLHLEWLYFMITGSGSEKEEGQWNGTTDLQLKETYRSLKDHFQLLSLDLINHFLILLRVSDFTKSVFNLITICQGKYNKINFCCNISCHISRNFIWWDRKVGVWGSIDLVTIYEYYSDMHSTLMVTREWRWCLFLQRTE